MERKCTQLSKEKEEIRSPRYSSCPPEGHIREAYAAFLTQLSLTTQSKRPHGNETQVQKGSEEVQRSVIRAFLLTLSQEGSLDISPGDL